MPDDVMNTKEFEKFQRITKRVQAILDKYEMVLLGDEIKSYNSKKPKIKAKMSTFAQAVNEGRIPGVKIGARGNWLIPRGAIEAAIESGLLTGKRGRPFRGEYLAGTCPVCGRADLRGTSKGLTVKHYASEEDRKIGKSCDGWGEPLVKPHKVME